jgi:hypothetical protein
MYVLTKEDGGLAMPLNNEKAVTCFSKTWDASVHLDLKGLQTFFQSVSSLFETANNFESI